MSDNNQNQKGQQEQAKPYPLEQYSVQPKQGGGGAGGKQDESPYYKNPAPQIQMPKGGGALKGIDEKFMVNAVNGTAGLEVALPLTPGRGGFTPALSLSYNSGSGNSEFGLGWNLSLPSIQRKTDKKLPQYNDNQESDIFLLAGAEDLIPELDSNGDAIVTTSGDYTIKRYRPRIEGLFARIEYIHKSGITGGWWRITTKDNTTTYYGLSENSRLSSPPLEGSGEVRIFKWLPQLVLDHKGNVQQFAYMAEDDSNVANEVHEKNRLNGTAAFANTYLKRVQYCNNVPYFVEAADIYEPAFPGNVNYLMEAVLDYGDHSTAYNPVPDQDWSCRSDAFSSYQAGFEIRTYRLCRRVLLFHHFREMEGNDLVRSMELDYQNDSSPEAGLTEADFIVAATQRGYECKGDVWHNKSLPAMTFDYEPLQWDTQIHSVSRDNFSGAPQGITAPYQWTDFEGEGISGILTEQGTGWFYKSNLGDGHFTPPKTIAPKPSFAGLSPFGGAGGGLQWQDLDADGRRQVVAEAPARGFWELDDDQKWQPFRAFAKNLNIDWNSPFTKMLDLNGDGKADVLITDDRAWTWYENIGTQGFDQGGYSPVFHDEEKGPVLILRDAVQSIFLASMSGGMTDLVRIKNGEVCYWPNMGYGKFGAKVTMSNAPQFHTPDLYNPQYLTLADISGTGAADLVYVGRNKCTAWINLAGNGWSEAKEINPLPGTDLHSKIAVLDFLGNGTGCIVWSSPLPQHAAAPLQYIDLMGGKKPYLMRSYNNGMGKTVEVVYKSSTQFYLADKLAGKPWATRLPFPVHCISSITTSDSVSDTSYTQTYQYRHGYYDHEEREFRGFGYVETLDIDRAAVSENAELDQPPVLTKTWYHTGAWLRKETLLNQFKKEYYQFGGWDDVTVMAAFPAGMSAQEMREAHRALKGLPLRQEVYAADGTEQEGVPYTVTANAYTVKRIQQQGKNRFASFISLQQQSIAFSCERNPDDPRILQELTLETDDYGNVLQSAQVAYPRKHADTGLPATVQQEQAKMHITYTQHNFTNDAIDTDYYRLRLPYESKGFELHLVPDDYPGELWQVQQLKDYMDTATVIDYADTPAPVADEPELRWLSCTRSLYLNDDTNEVLALGTIEALAIPFRQYTLAFTDTVISVAYDTRVSEAMLEEGAYVHTDDIAEFPQDPHPAYLPAWWLPSGTVQYSAAPQEDFYTPVSYTDPWSNVTTVSMWEDYYLLPESITDAKGNVNTVLDYDWRCLQPKEVKDANDNLSEICYDSLCMPVAVAVKGKGTQADYLLDSDGNPVDPGNNDDLAAQENFWTDENDPEEHAQTLLGRATWRCIYKLDEQPVRIAMIAREKHYEEDVLEGTEETPSVLIRVTYTDSFGRVAMHKVQCEDNGNGGWIGSGKTVYNNKGNPVLQYEPYFSDRHTYDPAEAAVEAGVSPHIFYDPLSRAYRTEMPDGSFSKVEWTAWMQASYDANDTVLDSDWHTQRDSGDLASVPEEVDADTKALEHYNTPSVVYLDTLARPFYTIQYLADKDIAATPGTDFYESYVDLDIQGNRLAVHDARGLVPLQYLYNQLKAVCYQDSIDSGTQRNLADAGGQPLYSWDTDDRMFQSVYDTLRRPVHIVSYLYNSTDNDWDSEIRISETIYGEGAPSDKVHNLRGKAYVTKEGEAQTTVQDYDFKGAPLYSFTQLTTNPLLTDVDWRTSPPTLSGPYGNTIIYDALGRPVSVTDPGENLTENIYDKGGALKTVALSPSLGGGPGEVVQDIHYDAKGRREAIWYGNGTKTSYEYDALNYRLRRLLTVNLGTSAIVQDLNYYYDPVGNITNVRDDAQQTVFFNNSIIVPAMDYTYDALYRLITAGGREHIGSSMDTNDRFDDYGWKVNASHPWDENALQNYTQQYTYDAVGNILSLQHIATYNSYTRDYTYDSASNCLEQTAIAGGYTYTYDTDERGNIKTMPHLSAMDWNRQNRLCHAKPGSDDAYYQYHGGQRIRKFLQHKAEDEESIYFGNYEIYRKYTGSTLSVERITVHITDDTGRIAMFEKRLIGTDPANDTLQRYIYSNHLGSASLELDENAEIISYEEYHPFGTTAYQAMNTSINAVAKRYKYSGKEKDEETGLYYHGARYYIPWLCRWCACDPMESKYAGMSPYNYGFNNPVTWTDDTGADPDEKKGQTASSTTTTTQQDTPVPDTPPATSNPLPNLTTVPTATVPHPVDNAQDVRSKPVLTPQQEIKHPYSLGQYIVRKDDTLTSISKKLGVSIRDLAKMNDLKGKENTLKIGQVLNVAPERDFSNNPRGGYQNSNNAVGVEYTVDNIAAVGFGYAYGIGSENMIIVAGKSLDALRNWERVQNLVNEGATQLWKDGKLTPGETFVDKYKSANIPTWVHNQTDDKFADKKIISPQHVMGSFGFSMRVNADGQTATVAVYDSKSTSSLSDNFLGQNANTKNNASNGKTPFTTRYIRFIWKVYLEK